MTPSEILALPPDARRNLLDFMKSRGGPAARAQALEVEAMVEKASAREVEYFLKSQPAGDRLDRIASDWRAGAERDQEVLQKAMVAAAPESALRFFEKGGEPTLPAWAYDEALLDYAKAHTRPGESQERALVRLIEDRDETVHALCEASRMSEAYERKRVQDERRVGAGDRIRKRDSLDQQMAKYADSQRRPGETEAQAYARLLRDDQHMIDLYRQHRGVE